MSWCLEFVPNIPFIETYGWGLSFGNGCGRNICGNIVYESEINEISSYLDGTLC
jgi:hypothetical protein